MWKLISLFFLHQILDNPLYDKAEWWCNFFQSFPFCFYLFNEYQDIIRNIHFKLLWFTMFFKYHSDSKEANSSALFETLNAVYSLTFNMVTIRESPWLPVRQSDYKTRQFPTNVISVTCEGSCTLFIRNMQSWWEFIMIKMSYHILT